MGIADSAVEGARNATGDDVIAAGWFHPRGYRGRTMFGSDVGMDAGRDVGDALGGTGWGIALQGVGAIAGWALGSWWGSHGTKAVEDEVYGPDGHRVDTVSQAADEASEQHGHRRWLVAVSPTRVYLLWPDHLLGGVKEGELHVVHTIERAELTVSLHARGTQRLVQLIDHSSGESFELEGPKLGWSHAKDVIHELTTAREPGPEEIDHEAEIETAQAAGLADAGR